MTLGGAAQIVAAHCLNERTLEPAVCSYNRPTYAPANRTTAFTPQETGVMDFGLMSSITPGRAASYFVVFLAFRCTNKALCHATEHINDYSEGITVLVNA